MRAERLTVQNSLSTIHDDRSPSYSLVLLCMSLLVTLQFRLTIWTGFSSVLSLIFSFWPKLPFSFETRHSPCLSDILIWITDICKTSIWLQYHNENCFSSSNTQPKSFCFWWRDLLISLNFQVKKLVKQGKYTDNRQKRIL